jgi:two-component sensor histidine kinase
MWKSLSDALPLLGSTTGVNPQQAEVLFRQLRHQTQNVLQRVISVIAADRELKSRPEGRVLAAHLEARILVAAEIMDQLFDSRPASMTIADRLRALGSSTITVLGSAEQDILLDVSVEGEAPVALHDAIVRITNEMVGNAVKHGMLMLQRGRIQIALTTSANGTTVLAVSDDGWGVLEQAPGGQGLGLISELAAPYGGEFMMRRRNEWTEAAVIFPPDCTMA